MTLLILMTNKGRWEFQREKKDDVCKGRGNAGDIFSSLLARICPLIVYLHLYTVSLYIHTPSKQKDHIPTQKCKKKVTC